MLRVLLCLLLPIGLMAQTDLGQSLQLTAPPPPSVNGVTAETVGGTGGGTYYYWVVARYPIGNSSPEGPAEVIDAPNLTATTFVRVRWNAQPGALTYDVLRTITPNVPSGATNSAVVIGTALTTVNDTGGALVAYTVTTAGAARAIVGLDNQNYTAPKVIASPAINPDQLAAPWSVRGSGPIASLPGTCSPGQVWICNGLGCGINGSYYYCSSGNVWTLTSLVGVLDIAAVAGGPVIIGGSTTHPTVDTDDIILPPTLSGIADPPVVACADGERYRNTANGKVWWCALGAWALDFTASSVHPHTSATTGGTLDAAATASGAFDAARIPNLDAAKITSGTLALARGGTNQNAWTASRCVQVNGAGTALESSGAGCGGGAGALASIMMGANAGVAASTTSFGGLLAFGWSATEALRSTVVPVAGTLGNFHLVIISAQSGTGNMVCTLNKNTVGSAISVTIAAGAPASTVYTDADTVAVAASDLLTLSCANAATATSATPIAIMTVN